MSFDTPSTPTSTGCFVGAKLHRRPQRQPHRFSRQHRVANVHRVLAVHHEDPLFDDDVGERETPDRQPGFEPELDQVLTTVDGVRAGDLVFVAEPAHRPVREPDALEHVIQHHTPPDRRRQRGDEQAVIPPRHDAGNRAGGVAAEAIRDQPFASRPDGEIEWVRNPPGGERRHHAPGTGRSSTADSAGSRHAGSVWSGGAPAPP